MGSAGDRGTGVRRGWGQQGQPVSGDRCWGTPWWHLGDTESRGQGDRRGGDTPATRPGGLGTSGGHLVTGDRRVGDTRVAALGPWGHQ